MSFSSLLSTTLAFYVVLQRVSTTLFSNHLDLVVLSTAALGGNGGIDLRDLSKSLGRLKLGTLKDLCHCAKRAKAAASALKLKVPGWSLQL